MAGSTRRVTGRGNRAAVRRRLSRDGGRGLEVSRGKREGESPGQMGARKFDKSHGRNEYTDRVTGLVEIGWSLTRNESTSRMSLQLNSTRFAGL
jgi:hypothetical protein